VFINYLKILLRNFKKYRVFSIINITGLAIGLTCSLLIYLWVQDELSFDKFHENSAQIFRVYEKNQYSDGRMNYSINLPAPIAPILESEIPEFQGVARFLSERWSLQQEEKDFTLLGAAVDPAFLEMFTFPLVKGNKKNALEDSYSIILTEDVAQKYFGNEDPVGEILRFENQADLKVTGVAKNIPRQSHLNFEFLVPLSLASKLGVDLNNWAQSSYMVYGWIQDAVSIKEVGRKILGLEKKHAPGSKSDLYLQPLTKIHLFALKGGGRIYNVYVFSLVAFIILIIACINFMNLSMARSFKRLKEIGVRRVIGANRWQLIKQIYSESMLFTFTALVIAIVLIEITLPAFNQLTQKQLELNVFSNVNLVLILIGIALLTGIISGSYPALLLSSFQPTEIFRGFARGSASGGISWLRKGMVIFQFMISVFLIISTVTIYKQLNYIHKRDLGIQKEHVLSVFMKDLGSKYENVKNEVLKNPNVLNATATFTPPLYRAVGTSAASWEGKGPDEKIYMDLAPVDYDFLETFGLKMAEGRFFSRDFSTDAKEAYIVNEAAVRAMGMESPVGKAFSWNLMDGQIIGVINDFHHRPLRYEIGPLILKILPWYHNLCIRIKPENIPETIAYLKEVWGRLSPGDTFNYIFLDQLIDSLYREEQRVGTLAKYAALLAIFVCCLGMLGLITYTAEQRTKEIGIRRVLGASVPGIMLLLTKSFTKWILLANFIAWPIAYYAVHKWLQNFAYRASITLWIFLASGLAALTIEILTVSYQVFKAASQNPGDSLRYE
jgi:putative ABC transport system permease protein